MPFTINQMIVDGDQNVFALNWAYSNADGTLSNQLKLAKPYGNTPLKDVTSEVAVEWLQEQLQNTTEQFDVAIAQRKAEAEYDKTLEPYAPHPVGPPTPITMPVPDEEIAASASKSTKKKK
jgi:hypothetical protein